MNKKILSLFISLLLIICAFFVGFIFADKNNKLKLEELEKINYRVDLNVGKNNLDVSKNNEKIEIYVNNKPLIWTWIQIK